ncbi:MAG: thiamine pyrophosphate-dependent enzyme [Myxococcota bacterium]|nr:thiamine pyrophosphate-dependent enzyme [Myxococcota bacterium]
MAQSVSQSLLDILAEAGARDIFGVTGDALNPLLECIRTDGRFRWIGVRHEEHAGYAAYAQSELTGGIGVCAGTTGPGALHLINGLYNAKKENGAVVAITGQVPRRQRGSDFHKEIDLTKMFDDICDYQVAINSPAQMPRMAEIAVQKALSERVVVRIELPSDVIGDKVPSQHFKHPLVHSRSTIMPPDEEIQKAAARLAAGKRVALLCGVGCRECKDEVLSLASKLNAPIVHTLRAKDIFDYGDANVVGMTGLIGNPAGYHAIWDCDVLLMLGTDFPYDEFIPDGIEIIQVDERVDHIGRRAPVTLGLVGTAKQTVAALDARLEPAAPGHFLSHLEKLRDKWLAQMDDQASLSRTDEPLHPQLFARAISDRAAADAFFAVDVGECTVWVARQVRMDGGRRMAGSFNHGSLGAGLPVALGAAALDPKRQVWAFCGDGGFGMSMNDFVTAVRFDWPIKVIVFNNSELGFVKMEMEVGGLPVFPDATALVNPDFAAYARACGGEGVRVEHAADIVPAVEQALASPLPFIIDAVVSAGELTMPPTINIEEAWGFGISKVKEALMGLRGDHDIWKLWRDEFRANVR